MGMEANGLIYLGDACRKRNMRILKVAQPRLGSALIPWLCDMESHHR